MSNHTSRPYAASWDILAEGSANSRTTLTLFYTRRSIPASNRAAGEHQARGDYWNREHIWPRSFGLKGSRADRDLHNLVPVDRTVNASRGNKVFDTAHQPHKECELCKVSTHAWEPPDEVKGDIARVLFYMDVRYEGETGKDHDKGLPDLVLANDADASKNQFGPLDTLLRWHCEDPVSRAERARNDVVAKAQGNRNLFVDKPQFVEAIYLSTC